MSTLDPKTANWHVFIFVAIIGFLGLGVQQYLQEQWREAKNAEPIENWFEVKSIHVPDFSVDEAREAKVTYGDRQVKRGPVNYQWTVKAEAVPEDRNFLCVASGRRDARQGEQIPSVPITDFMNCKWREGDFRLDHSWAIDRPGYAMKVYRQSSNVFHVRPPGTEPYVSEKQFIEQVQQEVQKQVQEQVQKELNDIVK